MKKTLLIIIAMMLVIAGQAFAYTANGLVAYYPLDGDANDASGNAHDGAVTGASPTADRNGSTNSAYSFNGSGYLTIPDGSDFNFAGKPFSISAWIRIDAPFTGAAGYGSIFDRSRSGYAEGYRLDYSTTSNSFRLLGSATLSVNYPLNIGAWYHVAVVSDGSSATIYVNGTPAGSGPYAVSDYASAPRIGDSGTPGEAPFNGAIDDIFVYGRALNSTEIGVLKSNTAHEFVVTSTGDGPGNTTNCPGASCRLRDAIAAAAAGDRITFDPSITGTITLTSGVFLIDRNLTLSGPGASSLTISGNNASRVFNVSAGVTVSLINITVANGYAANGVSGGNGEPGGGIINMGNLTVRNAILTGNHAGRGGDGSIGGSGGNGGNGGSGGNGGAIENIVTGTLAVVNTTFSGNGTGQGGKGGKGGNGDHGADFWAGTGGNGGNGGTGGTGGNGGGIHNSGKLTVRDSTFSGNGAAGGGDSDQGGDGGTGGWGTIWSGKGGDGGIGGTGGSGGNGGGIYNNTGTVAVENTTFTGNGAGNGGGVARGGDGGGGGGGDGLPGGAGGNGNTGGIGGDAGNGGGIFSAGTLTVVSSTFSSNRAGSGASGAIGGNGGGGYYQANNNDGNGGRGGNGGKGGSGGGMVGLGKLTIVNSTFSGNYAAGGGNGGTGGGAGSYYTTPVGGDGGNGGNGGSGGGIYNASELTIINATFSGNNAGTGGNAGERDGRGINNGIAGSSGSGGGIIHDNIFSSVAAINNTIVAGSWGGNCSGVESANGDHNLSDDGTCGSIFTQASPINLGTYGNYGGPTGTMPLLSGSPAIDAGNDSVCAAAPVNNRDQRGNTRPKGQHCDIGAFEGYFVTTVTALTLTTGATPSRYGDALTLTATLPGDATGTVTFTEGATTFCSAVQISEGKATCAISSLSVGSHTITASYGGDTVYWPSSGTLGQTVNRALTEVTITGHSPDPSYRGQAVPVTFTVTSSAGIPSGNVTISDGSESCTATVASGSCIYRPMAAGSKTLVATYAGDGNFESAISADISHTVSQNRPPGVTIVTNRNDNGTGSLREVIAAAVSGDTVTFDPSVTGTITLASGEITISRDVVITGPGASSLTISGGNISRVFYIRPGVTVSLSNVTVANGYAGNGAHGGGILNDGALTVTSATFSGNNAGTGSERTGWYGDNGGHGGGIFNNGALTVTSATFSGNNAGAGGKSVSETSNATHYGLRGGSGGHGGGIFNNGGALTVANVTFSVNKAGDGGSGGNHGYGGSGGSGGGIYNNGGVLTVANVTLSGGQAGAGGWGGHDWRYAEIGSGAGIYNSGTTTINNSIIAGGSGGGCGGDTTFTASGHNLSDDTTCGVSFIQSSSILLGALGDYGGPLQTIPLLSGSSAIDAGDDSVCAATPVNNLDQRGITRPKGPSCDIGAFEEFHITTATTLALTGGANPSRYGEPLTLTAAVTDGAMGTVSFAEGATTYCPSVPLSGGQASCAVSSLTTGSHTITATYNGYAGYSASTGTLNQTVNRAALSVTAEAASKYYEASDPTFTYTSSGLTNGDTASVFTGALGREPGEKVGDYNITLGTLSAGANYDLSFTGAKLTIVTLGVSAIIVNPDTPRTLVAGLYGAGIMRSGDGGSSWTPATTQPDNQGIKALVMHPATHATLYAAAYGGGIFRSVNSGVAWTACANTGLSGAGLNAVSLAITSVGRLYAGTEAGIFTSLDCATWSAVNSGLTVDAAAPPVAIAIDTTTPATLYAGLDGAGVFRSTDSGVNWMAATTQPTNLRVRALAIHPVTRSTLYTATYGGGVFASTDSGDHWTACANTNLTSRNLTSLTIDGNGRLYAGAEAGVFVSGDGCATWAALNGGLP